MKSEAVLGLIVLPGGSLIVGGYFAWRWWNRRQKVKDMVAVLTAVMPAASADDIADFAPAIVDAMAAYDISTPARKAYFIATIAVESDQLWKLRDTYGTPRGEEYESGKAYEGRTNLGNTQVGDGVLFKGRGLIQVTGRANYQHIADELHLDDLLDNPAQLDDPTYSALSAGQYWTDHNINDLADAGDSTGVRKAVNGGTNGMSAFLGFLSVAQGALGTAPAPSDDTEASS